MYMRTSQEAVWSSNQILVNGKFWIIRGVPYAKLLAVPQRRTSNHTRSGLVGDQWAYEHPPHGNNCSLESQRRFKKTLAAAVFLPPLGCTY